MHIKSSVSHKVHIHYWKCQIDNSVHKNFLKLVKVIKKIYVPNGFVDLHSKAQSGSFLASHETLS